MADIDEIFLQLDPNDEDELARQIADEDAIAKQFDDDHCEFIVDLEANLQGQCCLVTDPFRPEPGRKYRITGSCTVDDSSDIIIIGVPRSHVIDAIDAGNKTRLTNTYYGNPNRWQLCIDVPDYRPTYSTRWSCPGSLPGFQSAEDSDGVVFWIDEEVEDIYWVIKNTEWDDHTKVVFNVEITNIGNPSM